MPPLSVQQQYEHIDLKKIDIYRNALERLRHEMAVWDTLTKQIAILEARANCEYHGAVEPQLDGDGRPVDWDPTAEIGKCEQQRVRVLQALRQSLYRCTNQIKQHETQQKALREQMGPDDQEDTS